MLNILEKKKTHSRKILIERYNIQNTHQIPKIKKVSINMKVNAKTFSKTKVLQQAALIHLAFNIKPTLKLAKQNISAFKIRKGQILGIYGTLQKETAIYQHIKEFNSNNLFKTTVTSRQGQTLLTQLDRLPMIDKVNHIFKKTSKPVEIVYGTNAANRNQTITLLSTTQLL